MILTDRAGGGCLHISQRPPTQDTCNQYVGSGKSRQPPSTVTQAARLCIHGRIPVASIRHSCSSRLHRQRDKTGCVRHLHVSRSRAATRRGGMGRCPAVRWPLSDSTVTRSESATRAGTGCVGGRSHAGLGRPGAAAGRRRASLPGAAVGGGRSDSSPTRDGQ